MLHVSTPVPELDVGTEGEDRIERGMRGRTFSTDVKAWNNESGSNDCNSRPSSRSPESS